MGREGRSSGNGTIGEAVRNSTEWSVPAPTSRVVSSLVFVIPPSPLRFSCPVVLVSSLPR